MSKLPVIALFLEIFGFGLALLNTFYSSISVSIDKSVRHICDRLGVDDFYITNAAVDYDDDISPRDKDNIGFRRAFYYLIFFISFWGIFFSTDLGDSTLSQFFYSFVWALIIFISIRVFLVFFLLKAFLHLIDYFGKRNFVSGMGFLIGIAGLLINTYQIMISIYLWEGILIWAVALVIAYIFIQEKKQL